MSYSRKMTHLERLAQLAQDAANLETTGEGWNFGDAKPVCTNWPDVVRALLLEMRTIESSGTEFTAVIDGIINGET